MTPPGFVMKRIALILVIGALTAGAFAQKKVQLGSNFSDLMSGTSKSNIKVTHRNTSLGSQLAPDGRKDLEEMNRGVPEPATMAVLGIGVASLLRRHRKQG